MFVEAGDCVKMLLSLAVLGLRAVYFFFKLFLKPRNKITFLSRQCNTPSVDFEYLENAIKEQGFTGETKMLCKMIAPSIKGKIAYAFHILAQMYHIATSTVVVIDGYNIAVCVLKHKENQKFVQLWHALNIVKKFGYGALDMPWGHESSVAKAMCMHKNYTHIVACSEHSGRVLCQFFGASPEKMVLLTLPRVEYIIGSPACFDEIKKEYPNIFEKPILLYAPTFRGEAVDLSWIGKTVDFDKYNVVVKLHPADKHGLDKAVDSRVICDGEFSSFEWMKVCDSLITDYSGMGFEAMLRNKRVYYYLYDYKDYSSKNGLSIDLFSEEIAPYVVESCDELKAVLQQEYDFTKAQGFVEKYLSTGTSNCAKRLAEFVINLI